MEVENYSCPWCPLVVVVVESEDCARNYMETHLDGHFAQPIGRPEIPAARRAAAPWSRVRRSDPGHGIAV